MKGAYFAGEAAERVVVAKGGTKDEIVKVLAGDRVEECWSGGEVSFTNMCGMLDPTQ